MTGQPVFTCSLCSAPWLEKEGNYTCTFCRKTEAGEWICPNGHYICEECRLLTPEEIVYRVCMNTGIQDPWEIAVLVMSHPSFHPHGVEHHLVVTPAVLTALVNSGRVPLDKEKAAAAGKRTRDIPPGVCGSRGDCGAAIGAGAAISILARASFQADQTRSLVLTTAANALLHIAGLGGIRCCKQSVFAAIETCAQALEKDLHIRLEIGAKKCPFSRTIADCKRERCPYY